MRKTGAKLGTQTDIQKETDKPETFTAKWTDRDRQTKELFSKYLDVAIFDQTERQKRRIDK